MSDTAIIDIVVKLGGGTLADATQFNEVVQAIFVGACEHRILVVPGGGPFADAVRGVDRRFGLSDDTAHWMAVLAMAQLAHLVAQFLDSGEVVCSPREIADAIANRHVPVLAPSQWLQEADPLPHSWDVTSDSIAAWVAGRVGARRVVLVKPPGVEPIYDGEGASDVHRAEGIVDAHFHRALPDGVKWSIVPAHQGPVMAAVMINFESE